MDIGAMELIGLAIVLAAMMLWMQYDQSQMRHAIAMLELRLEMVRDEVMDLENEVDELHDLLVEADIEDLAALNLQERA